GARVIAVADSWDAMTSDRAYRRALPYDVAVAELRKCAGTQFDPKLVDLMLLPPVFERIVAQEREFHREPRRSRHERRRGERESATPDITFRWRNELREQPAQDLANQRSH
ncbi:MAG TPA: HD domain-containing phosphohydrolase, partial [Gemmatimonadaceae bacterium]|nr:HD domain-containing phosphohydrolase [Gemmatimonadaceae bacterium]